MFEDDFIKKVQAEKRQQKRITGEHRASEQIRAVHGRAPWSIFDSGIDDYLGTFGLSIDANFLRRNLKEVGQEVLGIDLMGQGRACKEVGCVKSLGVTLDLVRNKDGGAIAKEIDENRELIHGDIFSDATAQFMFEKIQAEKVAGKQLGIVFFMPSGGIELYAENSPVLSFQHLLHQYFIPLYNELAEHGVMVYSLPETYVPNGEIVTRFCNFLAKNDVPVEHGLLGERSGIIIKNSKAPDKIRPYNQAGSPNKLFGTEQS